MLGGQFDPPPSKSHVLCPNMTNDTSLESSCTLLLESAKKQRFSLLKAKAVIQAVCLRTQAVSIKARF